MESGQKKKFLTPAQALERLKKYCAYQERSHKEVRSKLLELGQRGNDLENIMTRLIEEGFLNEERFAIAFAGGKFRMKGWGRIKIEHALKARGVSTYCIQKALKQIGVRDYEITLEKAMKKKLEIMTAANSYERKQKLARFFIAKGYESEAVWKMVEKLTDD